MLNSSFQAIQRRTFLNRATVGIGSVAFATQLAAEQSASGNAVSSLGAIEPHHLAKAKRVIFLCMAGGPSHLETLDYKPKLAEMDGQPMPDSLTAGQPIAQLQGKALKCLAPQHKFEKFGESGQEISTALPHIAKLADDIAIVRSMTTQQINHDPAHTFMNSGTQISGRPCMGSWIQYGLGSEAEDLPGFVVLTSVGGGQSQPIASRQWHSGFLPSRYQGVHFHSKGDPVLFVGNPPGVNRDQQRQVIDAVNGLNRLRQESVDNSEIMTSIAQYELAFKMQASVPELVDLSNEPQHVLDMYGSKPGDGSFASNCLLARRLAERGVRFIQLYHRGWDHHGGVKNGVANTAKLVDRGSWALIEDLKQRDMLKDTLVIWSGEFGRTPMSQGGGENPGRDHHIKGFSMWMAGGGIRPGVSYGATDEFGYNAVEDVVSVHDFHATMLHLLGIDHQRFTYKFQGLDMKLTGVEPARVLHPIMT
ncbi:DUF1501 domain-containing protein [Neorhodopirellula pilleata]|uniref:Sulfatase n=1 Tax=Neorhodopirellula pilleata TaxID=2714738 RepID=A0A5C6A2F0_9BACT|nr:DUF1501 domain-containing protein [Neorhodopirellula pilleata]TWT93596.1 hypothetical protein Pla100_41140 [Neorhodopirellula pilleata]